MSTLEKVRKLVDLYQTGYIKTLDVHVVQPELDISSRLNYIYFTLPVCLNFQRSSPAMWAAALKTFNDPETNYLFYPEQVVELPREKIQVDLIKHKLSLQKNKHTDIWIAISKALNKYFENDPRNIHRDGEYDVLKVLEIIQNKYKGEFPYLRGPKLSNYWLYIQSLFTDVKLVNTYEISIIPDTHVIKSSVKLGLTKENDNSLKVVQVWRDLLKDSGISPVEVHPVLWNWSRAGFLPEV